MDGRFILTGYGKSLTERSNAPPLFLFVAATIAIILLASGALADGGCGCEKCDPDKEPKPAITTHINGTRVAAGYMFVEWVKDWSRSQYETACYMVCPEDVFKPYWNCTEHHVQGNKGEYCWLVEAPKANGTDRPTNHQGVYIQGGSRSSVCPLGGLDSDQIRGLLGSIITLVLS